MDYRKHVFVPSFEPPKSDVYYNAPFERRVSQLLVLNNQDPQGSSMSRHCIPSMTTSGSYNSNENHSSSLDNSPATRDQFPPSSIDLFEGKLNYAKPVSQTSWNRSNRGMASFAATSKGADCDSRKRSIRSPKLPSSECSKRVTEAKRPKPMSARDTTTTLLRNTKYENHEIPLSIEGIERFCRNVGASLESLNAFSEMCNSAAAFSFALIFLDGTTTHCETSVRLCVPSKPCKQWHCVCDRHIRARHASSPLMGAAVCLQDQEEHVYFLSLTNRLDDLINCATTLEQRWTAFLDIIWTSPSESLAGLRKSNVACKVLFNLQLSMHPVLHKLKVSNQQFVHSMHNNANNMFDVKIASHLYNSDLSEQELELSSISNRCRSRIQCQNSFAKDSGLGSVTKILLQLQGELQLLLRTHQKLEANLEEMNLLKCFNQIEMPIAKILSRMEMGGIRVVPVSEMDAMRCQMRDYVTSLESKAEQLLIGKSYSKPFNLASPEQVAHILFSVLKLGLQGSLKAPTHQTKGGKHQSTSEEALSLIKDQHPIVQVILSHRHVSKLLHTFIEGIQPYITVEHDQTPPQRRIYATWNQMSTRTGRFSCQKPNLQAFPNPKRARAHLGEDDINTNVRTMFISSSGGVLISADYSQIEVRVLAHMCGDLALMTLFSSTKGDVYKTLARIIFDKKDLDAVSAIEREQAKVICLGTMYGMGPHAAATKLGISYQDARSIVDSFYNKFRNVKSWIEYIKSDAKKKGYVATITGRKRFLPDITSTDHRKRSQAERQAVNSIIQGYYVLGVGVS
mmetsp:Transcript_18913/g.31578  ORF Transcript_18913/g.31578 Transcript_18913/m.31578 type:complete len:795 (-) Transcript_18913:1444-3828(-)